MKGDDDFLLTPLEEQTEDSTDSGSQVIALEGEFGDDATATLMAGDVPGLGAMLEADGLSPLASGATAGGMGAPVYMPPPEPSFRGLTDQAITNSPCAFMAIVGSRCERSVIVLTRISPLSGLPELSNRRA